MFQAFSKIFEAPKKQPAVKIIMVGSENAGRTTILYKMKLDELVTTVPTIGFNLEQLQIKCTADDIKYEESAAPSEVISKPIKMSKYKKIRIGVWDLGGQANVKIYHKSYYPLTNGIIYVIGLPELYDFRQDFIEKCEKDMKELQNAENLRKDACLLIFINKFDLYEKHHELKYSMDEIIPKKVLEQRVEKLLGLQDISRQWKIIFSCAITGQGLLHGFQWVVCNAPKLAQQCT